MLVNNVTFSPQSHMCTISGSTSIRHGTWHLWTKIVFLVKVHLEVKNMIRLVFNINITTAYEFQVLHL